MEQETIFNLPVILAIFFSFVIGAIFGGMAIFISKGVVFNRQLRSAQKDSEDTQAAANLEAK